MSTIMAGEMPSAPAPPSAPTVLAVRVPSRLARPRAGVLVTARGVLALAQRQPAAMLAIGVGAGLLAGAAGRRAGTALVGRPAPRPARQQRTTRDGVEDQTVAVVIEAVVVRMSLFAQF